MNDENINDFLAEMFPQQSPILVGYPEEIYLDKNHADRWLDACQINKNLLYQHDEEVYVKFLDTDNIGIYFLGHLYDFSAPDCDSETGEYDTSYLFYEVVMLASVNHDAEKFTFYKDNSDFVYATNPKVQFFWKDIVSKIELQYQIYGSEYLPDELQGILKFK